MQSKNLEKKPSQNKEKTHSPVYCIKLQDLQVLGQ